MDNDILSETTETKQYIETKFTWIIYIINYMSWLIAKMALLNIYP